MYIQLNFQGDLHSVRLKHLLYLYIIYLLAVVSDADADKL